MSGALSCAGPCFSNRVANELSLSRKDAVLGGEGVIAEINNFRPWTHANKTVTEPQVISAWTQTRMGESRRLTAAK